MGETTVNMKKVYSNLSFLSLSTGFAFFLMAGFWLLTAGESRENINYSLICMGISTVFMAIAYVTFVKFTNYSEVKPRSYEEREMFRLETPDHQFHRLITDLMVPSTGKYENTFKVEFKPETKELVIHNFDLRTVFKIVGGGD